MNLHVHSKNFGLTDKIKQYVNKRVSSAVKSRVNHVQRINVHLSDINGPHGGIDKRCHIHLVMPHMSDIIIRDTRENLYEAIDRAISRVKVTLSRKLERRYRKPRGSFAGDFSHTKAMQF